LLSAVYADFRMMIHYAFQHKLEQLTIYNRFFTEVQNLLEVEINWFENLQAAYKTFKTETITHIQVDTDTMFYDVNGTFANKVAKESNLSDLRYLFKYGKYISDNEIKTAEFLAGYDQTAVDELAEMTAKAYIAGFENDGKDISLRSHVEICFNIGQELMTNKVIEHLEKNNLTGFYSDDITTDPNKQYSFDHKFDSAIYLSSDYQTLYKEQLAAHYESMKDNFGKYSGIIFFEKFGETPFSPDSKDDLYKLDEKQTDISVDLRSFKRQKFETYMPEKETSFCIIAFPVPEIGDKFGEIFDETCKINKLDSAIYKPIQKVLIDALDQGDYVHVKGKDGNKTDIKVAMQPIVDPEKQTNYCNCGADVNIPVGEVFTSPQLKGTNGLLHIDTVFLNDFNFKELELTFEEGNITKYTCKNFDDEEKNIKFVEENLLFPHKSLPLGEFAIGTNTLAYTIAQKHNIVDILPILIVEKMGPHFAIGDTCYSWCEDNAIYNPDGKEIMSRDNERSLLRKESVEKAYTNIHIDITLPYDSIGHINAIKSNGETIAIIKDGRFALPGTEILNEPLK